MAVIEISRIQVRRGQENQTGLPNLAGGEFAWAADTENLYIGLKREDGGSRDANIRILTENDERNLRNLFSNTSTEAVTTATYVYKLDSYITAVSGSFDEVERTVQEKLDEVEVSVKDFGAMGDGVTVEDSFFQLAADNLFLNDRDINPHPARTLKIPAGTYILEDRIMIPENTRIVGDGIELTKIIQTSVQKPVFQTIANNSSSTNRVEFSDLSITISSPNEPNNVHIEGMTLEYSTTTTITQALSLIRLDCSSNSVIRDVKFKGHFVQGVDTATNTYGGIQVRGYPGTTNISIQNCEFDGVCVGLLSNHDIQNIKVENCSFSYLDRGVVYNDPAIVELGPRYSVIENSRFYRIAREGFFVGTGTNTTTGTFHVSKNNHYLHVGTGAGFDDNFTTSTNIITWHTRNNSSQNDFFSRYEHQIQNTNNNKTFVPIINSASSINTDHVYISQLTTTTNTLIAKVADNGLTQSLNIKYVMTGTNISRQGNLKVHATFGGSPSISIVDDYSYAGTDPTIVWFGTYHSTSTCFEIYADNNGITSVNIDYQTSLLV